MAQTRYWVSDVNANWNSDNWANSSNGAPDGGGPPTAAENARFDVNGSGNCTLNIALDTVTNLELMNYPATIEFDGNSLRATGTVTLTSGVLVDNSGGSVLTVVSTGVNTTFNGSDIGVRLDVTSDGIELDGSIFREYCDFEKTGNSNSYGAGGNYFYDTLLLEHSGSGGYILTGSNNPDTFGDFVSVTSSGSGYCYLAYSADGTNFQDSIEINSAGTSLGIRFGAAGGTSTVSAGHTIYIGSGGFTSGELELRAFHLLGNEAVSLTTTASSFTDIYDCSFGGDVTITSPRITTRGTTYTGVTSLTKTGANSDASAGGNRFSSNTTIENSGSGYLLFGNGSPDTFDLDLTWTNSGTHYSYLGYNSADNYIGGDLSITNSASGAGATYFYVSQIAGTSTTIDGNVDVLNNGSSDNCRVYFGDQGNVTVGGDAYFENSATGVTSYIQIADNTNSTVSFGGVVEIVNDGSMTTSNVYLGNNGDITVADSLYITNSSDADNSLVYCNHTTNSSATYSGDILIENTNTSSDGIYFGQAGGTSTQSAGQSFQIDNAGFTDGTLYLRNFIQQGASNVDLTLTNDAQLIIYDSEFGGDFIADAPNINTRGTSYGGDLTLRKTGSVNDNQAGGNSIAGVTILTNIGSGYWLWGNGSPDSFNSDLVVYDSSSYNFYLAYNSADNYINGDFTMYKANTGTSTYTYICDIDGTSLSITGNVLVEMASTSVTSRFYFPDNGALTLVGDYTINNNSDASSSGYAYISTNTNSSATIGGDVTITMGDDGVNNATYIGTNGDVTISGRVDIDNNSATDQSQIIIANGSTSDVTIGGVCNTENEGSGTTRRLYLGNYGNVDFGDSLIIVNSSDASNSQVYLNYGSTSTNTYAGDILLECTSADNDGVLFGNQTGVGTLAVGQTISISSNGFNGDYLYFRNFTQVGATAHTLTVDGDDGYIYNYSSNWGGNIDFTAPRMYTYDTRYNGDAILEKTGDGSDASPGINYFGGNTELINDGTGYFLMGNGSPDSFMLDLTLINTGTNSMYIGYNLGDNYVGGDLSVEQSTTGTSSVVYLSNTTGTTLQIDGDVSILQDGSATTTYVYLGNAGDVSIGGDLSVENSSGADNAQIFIANSSTCELNIGGKARIENSGQDAVTTRIYLGNYGDISISDSLIISNSSNSNNSQIYCNADDSSAANYLNDILIENSDPDGDGVLFGSNSGSATLAAGQTISIGSGGFVAGTLYFYNFTQVGATAQTLLTTGTTDFYLQDSDWGGDVDFAGSRMRTVGTRYNGTASLEKFGAIDDNSTGGNFFAGNTDLINSGSGYMMMGNGNPDSFMLDLIIDNSGTSTFYLAQNSADNYIGGDLDVSHTGSGTSSSMLIGNSNGSSLVIDGDATCVNNPTATSSNFYFGHYTDIQIGGNLDIEHTCNSNSNQFLLAYQLGSDVNINGRMRLDMTGAGTNSYAYLAYRGNLTVGDSAYLLNSSSATNSEIRVAYEDSADVLFNGDVVIESADPDCDGVVFGPGGGLSTLADGQRIVVGPNGFEAGSLYFYRFNQIGNTSQSITTTGTSYIYNYESDWDADLSLTGPRNRTDYSDFGGTLYFEKSGDIDEQGAGGNTVADTATLICSGDGYMMWGNTAADTFMTELNLSNTGTRGIYIANNQATHYVGGSITGSNTGTGSSTWIYLGNGSTSDLVVDGNINLTNNGTGTTTQIAAGYNGQLTVGGDLTMNNVSEATNTYSYVANGGSSNANVSGVTRIINGGSGTTHRSYLGNSGNVTCGDSLYLLNSSDASNSQLYVNAGGNSTGSFAGDIVVESYTDDCDGIFFGSTNANGNLAAGQTVTVGPNGFSEGQLYFRNFTQSGNTPQAITLTNDGYFVNYTSDWGGNVSFISPRFYTYSTRYRGTAYLEKNGDVNDASPGLNRIDGDATLVCSGSGYFLMGNGNPDSLMSNATFNNTGTYNMYFGHTGAGMNYVGGDLEITQNTTGTNTYFYLCNGNGTQLQVDGDMSFTSASTASNPRAYLGNGGSIDVAGRFDYTNTASGASSYGYVASGSLSTVNIGGVARFEQFTSGTTTHNLYIGNSGDINFSDSLYVLNDNSAANSLVYLNNGSTSNNVYDGPIVIENSDADGDGIYFGSGTGTGTLTAGNTIEIGPNGFVNGQLYFRNFDQQGGTAQALSLTGTSTILNILDCEWDGDLDFDAPRTYTSGTTYNGDFDFEKTGDNSDASTGGNIYNGNVTFTNSGTGYQMIPNNVADDFNGDLTLIKTSTGLMYPSYSSTSTVAGNINFDANTAITIGASSGRFELDGTGPQSINDIGTSTTPIFRRLELNNSSDSVTLNMPIQVQTEMAFTDGIMNSDTINILEILDNCSVTGASDASFVYGYVLKTGNDVFEFPVGDSIYRPISISNPSSGSAQFRATYNYSNPAPTYTYGATDAPIDHTSTREYWILDRVNTTNNVDVTLTWDVNSGGVTDLSELLVARWDGDSWTSEGNGGTTGNTTAGTIVTAAAVTNFSPFTLASSTSNNPLPIELLSFDATPLGYDVNIEWATATEVNNDYFTVERSADGIIFEAIETVVGAGNSVRKIQYETMDADPLKGVSYYRLKQTDYDGSYSYSHVEQVDFSSESNTSIFASNEDIRINASSEQNEQIEITIRDASGRIVHSETWVKSIGKDSYAISQSVIDATGVYLVTLQGDFTNTTERLFLR